MTQEKQSRLHSICTCGRESELLIGSRDFYIATRKIRVNHLPHFNCSYCDKASFDSSVHIDEALKVAYKNGQSEINYY